MQDLSKNDKYVQNWFSRVSPNTQRTNWSFFKVFCIWMKKTPTELIQLHEEKMAEKDPYFVLNKLQRYVNSVASGTLNTKMQIYTSVRSFYTHNRLSLPSDRVYRIQNVDDPVMPKLNPENLKILFNPKKTSIRYFSLFIVKYLSISDLVAIDYINRTKWPQIKQQLETDDYPIKVDIPIGRKMSKGKPFFTLIGTEGAKLLKIHSETEKIKKTIWMSNKGNPLSKRQIQREFFNLAVHTRLTKPIEHADTSTRYGFHIHELRDIALSQVQQVRNVDLAVFQYIAGHGSRIDRLGYIKTWEHNPEYAREEYRKAEPKLNEVFTWNKT